MSRSSTAIPSGEGGALRGGAPRGGIPRGGLGAQVCASLALILCLCGLAGTPAFGQVGGGPSSLREGLRAYQEGRYEAAVPHLEAALAADSLRPQTYATLALSLSQVGRPEEARAGLASGRRIAGEQPLLQMARAELLRQNGDLAEALSAYRELEKR